ncbi:MAG: AMP-binding protein [Actinobacteria bacterium]|nr:AMP-binding protein [Actinomycetota bacterium]
MALIPDQVRLNAEDHPDEIAYRVVGAGEMTFATWEAASNRLARGLIDAGVAKQDRVALLFEPSDAVANLQSYIAVHKAGAVTVPTNVRLSTHELRHVLGHAEPTAAIASPSLADRLAEIRPDIPTLRVVAASGPSSATDALTWDDLLADDDSPIQVEVDDEDMADILYTSGTTGLPKGIVVRHANATHIPVDHVDDFTGFRYVHASPFFTFAGLSFIFIPPRLGFTGIYLPRFDPGTWLDLVENEPVRMSFLVPAMVELLLAHDRFETADLSGLNLLSVGSAPIAPDSLLRLQRRLPDTVISNSYSMSEAGQAYLIMPPGELEKRPASVGRPAPPMEVRIVDDDGEEVPAGDIGEILMKTAGRQREYFRNPEATAELWREGWIHTGDLGKLDDDGYLYVVGRKKDVIIRGGHNIHATDVEHVIHEHPDVFEVAVVGVPHDVLGEDVAAFVVPHEGSAVTVADIATWCEERLADYKRPRRIEFLASLPRNAMGKVLKRELVPPGA